MKAKKLIYNKSQLTEFRKNCFEDNKKVVFVSGVFDILHVGHLKFLEQAKAYGDVLIVGINDDKFARTKGNGRPIQSEYDRATLVAGFECVSCVHIYDIQKNDALDILSFVRPDVFIMSTTSNRKPNERKHHKDLVEKLGGRVVVFDACANVHSTSLINRAENYSLNKWSLRQRLNHKKSKILKVKK